LLVVNPLPGGGPSNGLVFTILPPPDNPGPLATQLVPDTVEARGPNGEPVMVRVLGANFIAKSEVYFNDVVRATTSISPTELQVTLTMTDVANAGTGNLTVISPPPGGGVTSPLLFTVVEPGQDPPPTLSSSSPNAILAQGASAKPLVVRVAGSNFKPTAQAYWNGQPRTTTFLDTATLEVTLEAGDIAAGGVGQITVTVPGAGQSNPLSFMVFGYGVYMPMIQK
jgi:hypothetical protein